jgi:hypothetical protein
MLLRRRVATSLGDGIGVPSSLINDGLGHADGNQAGGHAVTCSKDYCLLHQGLGVLSQTLR